MKSKNFASNYEMFATHDAARKKNRSYSHKIHWSSFALVKTCVGITTSQTHTDQKPTELPNTQFAGSHKVPLLFWFSQVFQKSGGEKQWNASVIRETYKTNWQTGSHRGRED